MLNPCVTMLLHCWSVTKIHITGACYKPLFQWDMHDTPRVAWYSLSPMQIPLIGWLWACAILTLISQNKGNPFTRHQINEIYKEAQMFKIVNPSFKAIAKQSKQCNCKNVSPNNQDSAAKGTFIETVFTMCIFVSSFRFHSVFPPSDVWMLHRQGGPPMGPPTSRTAPPTWLTSLSQCWYRISPGLIKIKFRI